MKKSNSSGFVLAETLVVTTFVAGMLIFLFIQNSVVCINIFINRNTIYQLFNSIDNLCSSE